MSKKPSAETELKRAKAEANRLRLSLDSIRRESARRLEALSVAEAELKEWKERFDLLLRSKQENKP